MLPYFFVFSRLGAVFSLSNQYENNRLLQPIRRSIFTSYVVCGYGKPVYSYEIGQILLSSLGQKFLDYLDNTQLLKRP